MTQKHFVALAKALRAELETCPHDPSKRELHRHYAERIAEVCRSFNPLFKPERFLADAGVSQ